MPIPSATRRSAVRGVTLIEILVVLVILTVIASILVLSVRAADGSARARQEAMRLASRLDYACERAELSGRTIGLVINIDGYLFLRAEGDQWQRESDSHLQPFKLPVGVSLNTGNAQADDRRQLTPSILCFATGEITPFELQLQAGPEDDRYRLREYWPKPTRIERQRARESSWQALEL